MAPRRGIRYTAGVLTLTMPVAEQAKPRRIDIEGAEPAARQTISA